MTPGDLLYLSRADVEAAGVDMATVIALVEEGFREKAAGRVEMPPKPGIHPQPDAFIHAMPAYVAGMRSAGVKWVGGNPANPPRGLPYISGLIILNDADTCAPYAVMDCTWITGHRTGAATAVAAKHLARPESRTAGIIACGLQGRTNLLALAEVFTLSRVYAFDTDDNVQRRFVAEMSVALNLEVIGVRGAREAVTPSDLVVTSGPILKHPAPTIRQGLAAAGRLRVGRRLRQLLDAGRARPVRPDRHRRPRAVSVPTGASATSSRRRTRMPTSASWPAGRSRGGSARTNGPWP